MLTGSPAAMSAASAPDPASSAVTTEIFVEAWKADSRTEDSFTCESAEYSKSGYADGTEVVVVVVAEVAVVVFMRAT